MRLLTDEQGAEVKKRLQGHSGTQVVITYVRNNLNSHKLAYDFYDVLQESGWPVEEPCPLDMVGSEEVQVAVSDYSTPPKGALLLLAVFPAAGIRTKADLVRGRLARPGGCVLMVGTGC